MIVSSSLSLLRFRQLARLLCVNLPLLSLHSFPFYSSPVFFIAFPYAIFFPILRFCPEIVKTNQKQHNQRVPSRQHRPLCFMTGVLPVQSSGG